MGHSRGASHSINHQSKSRIIRGGRAFGVLAGLLLGLLACGPSDDGSGGDETLAPPTISGPASAPSAQPLSFAVGTDATHPPLSNLPGANTRNTGITVRAGDSLEIRPASLVHEERSALSPKVTKIDNPVCVLTKAVCVASQPIVQQQCDDSCNICLKCLPFTTDCIPWRCCNTVCKEVTVGSRCTQTVNQCAQEQDQWKEYTEFPGLGPSTTETDNTPMTESASLLAGLKLAFTPPSSQAATATCPLSQFRPKTTPTGFMLTFVATDSCPDFSKLGANQGMFLSITNQLGDPISYQTGLQIKAWDGTIVQAAPTQIYTPLVEFSGMIILHPAGR